MSSFHCMMSMTNRYVTTFGSRLCQTASAFQGDILGGSWHLLPMGSFWGATQKQLSTKNMSGNLKGRWKPDMTRSSPRKQGYIWKGRFPQFWHNLKSRIQNKEDKSNQAMHGYATNQFQPSISALEPLTLPNISPWPPQKSCFHNSSLLVNHPWLGGGGGWIERSCQLAK